MHKCVLKKKREVIEPSFTCSDKKSPFFLQEEKLSRLKKQRLPDDVLDSLSSDPVTGKGQDVILEEEELPEKEDVSYTG